MQYFLNDTVYGPYSGICWGQKGDEVTLVSMHGDVAIVRLGNKNIAVKAEKLSKKEVEQDPVLCEKQIEQVKAVPAPSKSRKGKTVTNQSNNIQSLF